MNGKQQSSHPKVATAVRWQAIAGFLLLLFPLLACATSTPAGSSTSSASAPSDALLPATDHAPILLRTAPSAGIEILTSGDRRDAALLQSGDVRALLAGRHMLFDGWLIADNGRYFRLPAGIVSPDGRWLVDTSSGVRLMQIDGAGERLLSESGAQPLWSPDGRMLAFQDAAGVRVADTVSGEVAQLGNRSAESPLAWSPDGERLLTRMGNGLYILQRADGARQELSLRADRLHGTPVWSSDGATLHAIYGAGQSMEIANARRTTAPLVAIDLTTMQQRVVAPGGSDGGVLSFILSPDETQIAFWYAACRLAMSQLVPLPVRQCSHEIRLAPSDGSAHYAVATLAVDTAQFTAPQLAWQHWREPTSLALDAPIAADNAHIALTGGADNPGAMESIALDAVPVGETATVDNRRFRLNGMLSGEDAFKYASDAATSTLVLPPVPGFEYAVILVDALVDAGTMNLGSTSIRALGAHGALYKPSLLVGADGSEGRFNQVTLRAQDGEGVLGFVFTIPSDEELQTLLVQNVANLPAHSLALRAAPSVLVSPSPLAANMIGSGTPARVGETVVVGDWAVTLHGVAEDDATGRALRERYLFGDDGVAAKVTLHYSADAPAEADGCLVFDSFFGIGGSWVVSVPYDVMADYTPVQDHCLLAGGVTQNWLLVDTTGGADRSVGFALPGSSPRVERYFALP